MGAYLPEEFSWKEDVFGHERGAVLLSEKELMDRELYLIERTFYELEGKMQRFRSLGYKYEEWAGTAKGEEYRKLMGYVKHDILKIWKELARTLDETVDHQSRIEM